MNDYALSSGEGEIVATSELMKDGIMVQFNLEFAGMGSLPIQMFTDASVARQFVHRLGVGRMKHLDVRLCWLQDQHKKGVFISKKIPRDENPADMLTHVPAAKDIVKFREMLGLYHYHPAVNPN